MTKLSVITSRALLGIAFLSLGANAATINDKTNFDKNFESSKKDGNYTTKKDAEFPKADSEISYDFTKTGDNLGVKNIKIDGDKQYTLTLKKEANFGGFTDKDERPDTSSAYGFEISAKSTILGDGTNETKMVVSKVSKITGLDSSTSALELKDKATLAVLGAKLDVTGSKTTLGGTQSSIIICEKGVANFDDIELTAKANIFADGNSTLHAKSIKAENGGDIAVDNGSLIQTKGDFIAKDITLSALNNSQFSIGGNLNLGNTSTGNEITLQNSIIKVKGDANITNTKFNLEDIQSLVGRFDLVQVGGKFNENIVEGGSNTLDKVSYQTDIKDLLTNKNLLEEGKYELKVVTKGTGSDVDGTTLVTALGLDYKLALSKDGKTLYVNGEAVGLDKQEATKILQAKATAEKALVDAGKTKIDKEIGSSDSEGVKKAVKEADTAQKASQTTTKEKQTAYTQAEEKYNKDKTEENKKALETAQKALDEAKKAELNAKTILDEANKLLTNLTKASEDLQKRSETLGKVSAENDANKLLGAIMAGGNSQIAGSSLQSLKNKNQTLTAGLLLDSSKLVDMSNAISNSGNVSESQKILDSLAETKHDAGKLLNIITRGDFYKSTRESAKSVAYSSNTSSSALNAVNISNDMSLSTRFAKFNNPYSKTYFASLATDAKYDYYESYNNSVWVNVFGGANIIDGNNAGVYGISLGADKNINENVLIGAYFTYADASLKDTNLRQDSDNYQLGLYSLIKLPNDFETNLKIFGQIGKTNQDISTIAGINSSDFDRKFFGISANVGKVFGFGDMFVKPFVGLNYYYTRTPGYTEKGTILAQNVLKSTNNSASLEAGVELRKYFDSNSYLYVTPKLEQYILNNGDDYTASFVGSNSYFKVDSNEKKKTYGQLIIGGNLDVNDSLSLNLGVGAKQILAGKVDSKNETYLSGNIGLKYKF
ncbi:autotransporter outer membrane beta-barrel domain-containing protein [Helicobacter burdigaliensis]|uniref:autotransporter outer membrane beta-barrel domain-containing protein n=1 Tax=Helicobacter burdigaliensis TaxID=2315334 RepID=UPI001E4ECAE5|nr:autotransporter outer membrane beta-barrel domain-containing protein [Helicobacter burdigaliensis]